jgi:hypothetical protein
VQGGAVGERGSDVWRLRAGRHVASGYPGFAAAAAGAVLRVILCPAGALRSLACGSAGCGWCAAGREPRDYSAAITEVLLRAGYEGSAQVGNTLRWLLAMRQDDGGWAIPARMLGLPLKAMLSSRGALEPGRSCPSSHLVTGVVVRALAAHPRYRRWPGPRRAAELLKSRFFRRYAYPDRAAPSYWLVFSCPCWRTGLLPAPGSLAQTGFRVREPGIARGHAWFISSQEPSGLRNTGHSRPRGRHGDLWAGLAVCRMLNAVRGNQTKAGNRPGHVSCSAHLHERASASPSRPCAKRADHAVLHDVRACCTIGVRMACAAGRPCARQLTRHGSRSVLCCWAAAACRLGAWAYRTDAGSASSVPMVWARARI